jgi:hypothetical protein
MQKSDPVRLMKALRDTHIVGVYSGSSVEANNELMKQLHTLRQREKEDVYAYLVRSKELVNTCKSKALPVPSEANVALCFLQGLRNEYLGMFSRLREMVLTSAGAYPETIEDAASMAVGWQQLLSQRNRKDRYSTRDSRPSRNAFPATTEQPPDSERSSTGGGKCFACGSTRHQISDCPELHEFKRWKEADKYEVRAVKSAAPHGPDAKATTDKPRTTRSPGQAGGGAAERLWEAEAEDASGDPKSRPPTVTA